MHKGMKLFLIDIEAASANLCALVIANNDREAVSLWRRADFVDGLDFGEEPRVFVINPAGVFGPARVLKWHTEELRELTRETT